MRLALAPGTDGWNAQVSSDGKVACGRGQLTLVSLLGEIRTFPERQRPMGWLDNDYLAVQRYEDNCEVLRMYAYTGSYSVLATGQNIQRAAAGQNNWVGGYAATRRVVWDGVLVEDDIDWHCGGEGPWCVILSETHLHIYRNGVFQRTVPHQIVRDYAIVREGYCGIGRNGPPLLVEVTTGSTVDVTVTPWRKECEPVYSNGWVCTTTELPTPQALVRPLGALDVIALPVPEGAVGCDFRVVGNRGIVATWSDQGQCVIQDCDLTQPRTVLEPMMPPVTFPPLPDPALIGGFFVGTYRYGGDNGCRDVFGNCAVLVGESAAAETLDPMTDGQLRYRVIDPGAIPIMAQTPEMWASVGALYIAAERAGTPLESCKKQRLSARYMMDLYTVPYKPIIGYLGSDDAALKVFVDSDPQGQTMPGIQLYLDGTQLPQDLWAIMQDAIDVFPTGPLALIAQAYTRNGTYTGSVTDLVPVFYDIIKQLGPRHKATLAFSYKRPTGILDLVTSGKEPHLHEAWVALANAIQRPA